jgi:ADP-ribose/FAD diphosphatase
MQYRVPDGDTHPREVCGSCGVVEYRNPRLVVGALVTRGPGNCEVLLCRRAIEPQLGLWTLPAGYLEVGESTADGARREVLEETGAEVEVLRPYAHFDVPAVASAWLLFLAKAVEGPRGEPRAVTPESLETRWFSVVAEGAAAAGGRAATAAAPSPTAEPVPWSDLAFSSVTTALRLYAEDVAAGSESSGSKGAPAFRQHHGVIERQKGAGPNAAGTYFLRDHTWTGGGGSISGGG